MNIVKRASLELLTMIYDLNKEPAVKRMAAKAIQGVILDEIVDGDVERKYHLEVFSKDGTLLRSANYPTKEQANGVAKEALSRGWIVKGEIRND